MSGQVHVRKHIQEEVIVGGQQHYTEDQGKPIEASEKLPAATFNIELTKPDVSITTPKIDVKPSAGGSITYEVEQPKIEISGKEKDRKWNLFGKRSGEYNMNPELPDIPPVKLTGRLNVDGTDPGIQAGYAGGDPKLRADIKATDDVRLKMEGEQKKSFGLPSVKLGFQQELELPSFHAGFSFADPNAPNANVENGIKGDQRVELTNGSHGLEAYLEQNMEQKTTRRIIDVSGGNHQHKHAETQNSRIFRSLHHRFFRAIDIHHEGRLYSGTQRRHFERRTAEKLPHARREIRSFRSSFARQHPRQFREPSVSLAHVLAGRLQFRRNPTRRGGAVASSLRRRFHVRRRRVDDVAAAFRRDCDPNAVPKWPGKPPSLSR